MKGCLPMHLDADNNINEVHINNHRNQAIGDFLKEAVFSDGTKWYRNPEEPMPFDAVKIKLRTGKDNVDEAFLVTESSTQRMIKSQTDDLFDYYEGTILLEENKVKYYFTMTNNNTVYYYDKTGVTNAKRDEFSFSLIPGFKTPKWAKGAVFYQIFVDRFYNGDDSNDVLDREYFYIGDVSKRVTDWSKYPDSMGIREFYGGDLLGIMKKLDYLQDLGVEVLYLNPIFVSPSNHKYDVQDYDYIDPHYGVIVKDEGECLPSGESLNKNASKYICRVTNKDNLEASNQLFIKLVEEVHKRGMRIILDGVFNHCGSFNKWLDKEGIYEKVEGYEKGAYVAESSPYHTFFRFHKKDWPYNGSYEGWWGHDTLPKLNYEDSKTLYEYIIQIAKKWVSPPFCVDGWRLDVAADLAHSSEFNHNFWKDFRKAVKEANPNAIILAEHYGDPSEWLQGDEWDTIMNYDAFMEPITWFLTGVEKHSDDYQAYRLSNTEAFFGAMTAFMAKFHTPSLQTAMNELSNHDHSRFLTRTNHRVGRVFNVGSAAASEGIHSAIMRMAVVMQMTWPGAPTIYYGDEAGLCGWTDPDNRRTYPWGNEDHDMICLHKEAIKIHKSYDALRVGSIKFLGGTYGILYYGRFDDKDKFVILINNNSHEIEVLVPVWEIGVRNEEPMVRIIYTNNEGFGVDTLLYWPTEGRLKINLEPYSSLVLKNLKIN